MSVIYDVKDLEQDLRETVAEALADEIPAGRVIGVLLMEAWRLRIATSTNLSEVYVDFASAMADVFRTGPRTEAEMFGHSIN
ncbi:hypothetical protein IZ6_25300 [Terrihabitans soli]|uniref:Uncharacterized protein n=1 Tax=Terrihabitans soli TaxID=708113 RepID=A0A6S6QW37_9HYPH|nr:hypothetical protein [Terrihabitans soli]BCJ91795.1 hypothetical protein IZ6_25300 [Terrihabitans soli]